jgi:hypothetical protein
MCDTGVVLGRVCCKWTRVKSWCCNYGAVLPSSEALSLLALTTCGCLWCRFSGCWMSTQDKDRKREIEIIANGLYDIDFNL